MWLVCVSTFSVPAEADQYNNGLIVSTALPPLLRLLFAKTTVLQSNTGCQSRTEAEPLRRSCHGNQNNVAHTHRGSGSADESGPDGDVTPGCCHDNEAEHGASELISD